MPTKTGTIRVKVKGLQAFEKTSRSWKKSTKQFPDLKQVVKLFKAQKNFKVLVDTKDSRFLKGQISKEGQPQGARINILPNGEKIDKAFSLFGEHLRIHDQDSHDHWDVLYHNKGGTWSYCYTLEKKKLHKLRKFKKVQEFDKIYPKLARNVSIALKNPNDDFALPMYTLLKTYMRIGNETYYKAHKHKGLTTLKKKDVTITKDKVTFNYLAKDGVPRLIEKKFPVTYISRLKKQIRGKKKSDFLFTSSRGKLFKEQQFKKAFEHYCGKEFYPHIVRSHYATSEVKKFLKGRRKASKKEVDTLFLSIASKLGHKRFIKKKQVWEDNYTVTVNHYVQPELVERVRSIIR